MKMFSLKPILGLLAFFLLVSAVKSQTITYTIHAINYRNYNNNCDNFFLGSEEGRFFPQAYDNVGGWTGCPGPNYTNNNSFPGGIGCDGDANGGGYSCGRNRLLKDVANTTATQFGLFTYAYEDDGATSYDCGAEDCSNSNTFYANFSSYPQCTNNDIVIDAGGRWQITFRMVWRYTNVVSGTLSTSATTICQGSSVNFNITGGTPGNIPRTWIGAVGSVGSTALLSGWNECSDCYDGQTNFSRTFNTPGIYLIRTHPRNCAGEWNWASYSDVWVTVQSTTNNPGIITAPTSICVGGAASISNVTAASTGTPASTGPNYYYYYQRTSAPTTGWVMYQGPTTGLTSALPAAVINTAGTYLLARNSEFGCAGQTSAPFLNLTVVADPTAPTLGTATPTNGSNVCAGSTVSATVNNGAGGLTCTDEYRYSTNGGSTWNTYTSGSGITVGALGTTTLIQGRRNCTGTGCDGSAETFATLASWNVNDVVLPSITCPGNITQTNTVGTCGRVITYTAPTGTDNCPGATTTQIAGLASGATFPVGITTNTFRVTDAAGNSTTCSFTVTITDTQFPSITCPGNISQPNTPGVCGATVTYTAPIGTDNCPGASTIQIAGLASGATFPLGLTTNTFRVTDAAGNSSTCSFTVTITDTEDPSIVCPSNITTNTDPGICGAVVTYAAPLGTDNCPGASTTQIAGLASGATFPLGLTTNTFRVVDGAGNSSTCSFTVTVSDNIPPVATCQNVTVYLDGTGNASVTPAQVNNSSSDNCGTLNMSLDQTIFNCSNLGPNTVTLTVEDGNGNSSTCTSTVTVVDNMVPVITCAANVNLNVSCTPATITLTSPTVSDNCTTTSVTNDHPGTTYPAGVTTVVWTATDVNGNSSTCLQTVTVTSPEAYVTGNGWEVISGSTIISITNGTDFGNVQLCSTMVKTYVFKNRGTGNITLPGTPNTAALSGLNAGDFSIISMPPSGTVLVPGASANFTVLFDPSALGFRNARLTILNTDCNEAVYSFAIRGKGMTCSPSLVPDPSGQTQTEGNDHSEEENNTTSVEETNTLTGTLYPNPGNGIFTLELSEMPRGKTEFRLVDILGQMIYTTRVVSQSTYCDFSYLSAGTYYVQVISNESSFTKQIIITQGN